MSRDVVLAVLIAFVCGPLLVAIGAWSWRIRVDDCPYTAERALWRRVWAPLLPAALVAAAFVGWALQEPSITDEKLRPFVFALALPFAIIWLRAVVRALWSLRRPRDVAAATVGLVRPRVALAQWFARRLDPAALAAVLAHEAAHARHRDPLRLWLAQLVTDLQWPALSASSRLRRWQVAVEVARDAEACASGVSGADLAAAIVAAARWGRGLAVDGARIEGGDLSVRIARLLTGSHRPMLPRRRTAFAVVALAIAAALLGGYAFGEHLLRAIPGVQG